MPPYYMSVTLRTSSVGVLCMRVCVHAHICFLGDMIGLSDLLELSSCGTVIGQT